ncbi:MAG: hypothetical protein IPH13_07120 [Planctomycetes bacterium]|nr:hypothetical protein [Planctomycetota bacterium]MCC7170246.1 hypothetical protein [Planctomycetota bacterium]
MFKRILVTLCALATMAAAPVSYRSIVDPAAAKAFYADGGASRLHQRVHLHVPAERVLARAETVVDTAWGRMVVLRNRSVPLLVAPGDVYFRKIRQRVNSGDTVCVKGVVKPDPRGTPGRTVLYVHQLKKADDDDAMPRAKRGSSKSKSASKPGG